MHGGGGGNGGDGVWEGEMALVVADQDLSPIPNPGYLFSHCVVVRNYSNDWFLPWVKDYLFNDAFLKISIFPKFLYILL